MGARPSPTVTPAPTVHSVLAALSRERLFDLGRVAGASVPASPKKNAEVAHSLLRFLEGRLPEVIRELGRDELRAVCKAHGLDDSSQTRVGLVEVLAGAAGFNPAESVPPPLARHDGLPRAGQVLNARHRQWLVEGVEEGGAGDSPLLRLACLDDDAQGQRLDMLWDLELGAEVVAPEVMQLASAEKLDPPASFGAYLHALKWSAVSAADATRFQAPFRAGIKVMAHQLTPLMKALELPRANLFIADDVGLGKTIEAGLVLQELILRQQAGFVLVVCPASVSLQWRDEMLRRFGLRFEVMTREYVARRRQERGFGWNPWSTHHRFIVSHSILRRPEYFEPLMDQLKGRAEKGLLILDEAHIAAPASASKYALDTETTRTIRELAPKFDNRLFLSATPHNGHSNSFSALLEILDPIRFTRGQAIAGKEELKPIMVRRLKRDLRQIGVEGDFPRRILVQILLEHRDGGWSATQEAYDAETGTAEPPRELGRDLGGDSADLRMAEALRRYTQLCDAGTGLSHYAFVGLQKRMLSSPAAFARSLTTHAETLESKGGLKLMVRPVQLELIEDPEAYGPDDEVLAAEDDAEMERATRALPSPTEEATALLREMRALAENAKGQPDAKVRVLFAWMREHLCPAIGLDPKAKVSRKWADRRVILFTEYADTKRYLLDLLEQAIAHTDAPDGRVRTLHGGMGDEGRDEVQRAFNARPDREPVRILVATDAAREGVNLQGHCADLFHIDVPWNPSRMEQRNGRIDRTLQQAAEVRCHYFVYPQRSEDRVLETLVRKIATVQRELGSAGAVLLDEMDEVLEGGIDAKTAARLQAVGQGKKSTAEEDLEAQRKDLKDLEADIHRAAQRLERSEKSAGVSPSALRGVVDVGLRLAGAAGLAPAPSADDRDTFTLPELDRSWQDTLDTLRPRRGRTEAFWEWRKKPPRPVTFEPIQRLTDEVEQLHLAHPLVRRILDRFLAQGFSAHDLSRVCGVVVANESVARVVAYGRLTLFGVGAARLHDEIIAVTAPWPIGEPAEVAPYKDAVTAAQARNSVEAALAAGARGLPAPVEKKALARAPALFAALWPHLDEEANARAVDARTGLGRRARKESDELRDLLRAKRDSLAKDLTRMRQLDLFTADASSAADRKQKRQVELDIEHLQKRAGGIGDEIETEPKAIEALYDVRMTRKTPLGLVVAWPEGMT